MVLYMLVMKLVILMLPRKKMGGVGVYILQLMENNLLLLSLVSKIFWNFTLHSAGITLYISPILVPSRGI